MPYLAPLSVRATLLALALGMATGLAQAQASPEVDAMGKLLVEKGLVDAATLETPKAAPDTSNSLGQQVRATTSGLVDSAMNFIGVRYKRGGNSAETGFDCSGFTRHIFENSLGLVLPRRADEQAKTSSLVSVNRDELKPGDLVFFNTMRRTFSHVGIYVGDDKFIHAPRKGGKVRVESMSVRYWAKRFTGARRAPQASETSSTALPSTAFITSETPPSH